MNHNQALATARASIITGIDKAARSGLYDCNVSVDNLNFEEQKNLARPLREEGYEVKHFASQYHISWWHAQ